MSVTLYDENNVAYVLADDYYRKLVSQCSAEKTRIVFNGKELSPVPRLVSTSKPVTSSTDDPVNHPHHYTQGRYECIKVMEDVYGPEIVAHFCLCNAFKYTWRTNDKNGIQDMEKAKWYSDKYVELMNKIRNENRNENKSENGNEDKEGIRCRNSL